jgi:transcriptional regulator with XRE-family HTH domain
MEDHRAVRMEVLQDFVRTQAELSSIRQVAAEVGLGRTTIHAFVNGESNPHPRVRRTLALWYLQKSAEAPDIDVARPYAAALGILLAALPESDREAGTAVLLEALEALHAGAGSYPRWLELLLKGVK